MMTQFFHKMKYDLKGHIRPLLYQKRSRTFVYEPILTKICMNANIMKTHFFLKSIYDLKCHCCIMEEFCNYFFTLRPSDLISTLTYVALNNFHPCFYCLLTTWCCTICIKQRTIFLIGGLMN